MEIIGNPDAGWRIVQTCVAGITSWALKPETSISGVGIRGLAGTI
jgi:hypothetical protein